MSVADAPEHTVGEFTATVGNALMVTVPESEALTQDVVVLVIITE